MLQMESLSLHEYPEEFDIFVGQIAFACTRGALVGL